MSQVQTMPGKTIPQVDEELETAEPAVAQMLRAPHSQSWWSAQHGFDMTRAIVAVGGTELVRRVGQVAVAESISLVIRPLVAVVMAISGPSPATLFARFGQISGAAIKNVKFVWKQTGDTTGELTITYPVIILPEYAAYWLGAFDFVWVTTKKVGQTIATHHGASLHFALSWAA